VWIYGWKKDGFKLERKLAGGEYNQYLRVEVADTNGNRVPEILVTNVAQRRLQSLVYEWSGKTFSRIAVRVPYFLAVVDGGPEGPLLVGQALGRTDPLGLPVHALRWDETRLVQGDEVDLPRGVDALGYQNVYLGPDRARHPVAFSSEGEVRVYEDGDVSWESAEEYDGSLTAFTASSKGGEILGGGSRGERTVYVPGRIVPLPSGAAGNPEILVRRNEGTLGNVFERIRVYDGGRIHALAWSETGFVEAWRTPYLDGYVSDFTIADLDGDGVRELVVAVVKDADFVGEIKDLFGYGSAERGAKTVLLAYDLETRPPTN